MQKKLFTTLTCMLLALFTLSSCSEDAEIGLTLEGTWSGNMHIYTQYSGRRYQTTATTIQFTTKGLHLTKGNGYWVDYYSNAPWDYVASRITWRVDDAVIHIHFVEDNTDVDIYHYELDNNHFSGVIYYDGQTISFNFTPNNNFDYDDYNYYGYNDGWGFYSTAKDSAEKPVRCFGSME